MHWCCSTKFSMTKKQHSSCFFSEFALYTLLNWSQNQQVGLCLLHDKSFLVYVIFFFTFFSFCCSVSSWTCLFKDSHWNADKLDCFLWAAVMKRDPGPFSNIQFNHQVLLCKWQYPLGRRPPDFALQVNTSKKLLTSFSVRIISNCRMVFAFVFILLSLAL